VSKQNNSFVWWITALFLGVRLVLLTSLPLDGLRGFGDLVHFYRLAGMGWPILDYWVEFPPLFPFLSRLLYLTASGREHIYDYLLVLILSVVQAGSLAVFILLAQKMYSFQEGERRSWVYFAVLICLSYGWWYFDPISVLFTLLGILWMLKGQDVRAGFALALGTLTKFFPAFLLPVVWRYRPNRQAVIVSSLTVGITIIVYAALYLFSPAYTAASLRSQVAKGSWETVWALVDGNFNTGNFGPESERYNPSMAHNLQGNPPRIPTYLTLLPFLAFGGWLLWKARIDSPHSAIAFLGLTWCIFLLWSPGWSPQWVLYLLPLILLTLPFREAILTAILMVFINVLEWPVLLSRGYTWGLWLTIPVRTLVIVLLGYLWYRQVIPGRDGAEYIPTDLISSPKVNSQN
jgi:hypothetical protein